MDQASLFEVESQPTPHPVYARVHLLEASPTDLDAAEAEVATILDVSADAAPSLETA